MRERPQKFSCSQLPIRPPEFATLELEKKTEIPSLIGRDFYLQE
jgi:hypothetical protein